MEIFIVGASLMWCIWKYHCKWAFKRDPFTVDTIRAMEAATKVCSVGARHNAAESVGAEPIRHAWQPPDP